MTYGFSISMSANNLASCFENTHAQEFLPLVFVFINKNFFLLLAKLWLGASTKRVKHGLEEKGSTPC